MEKQNKEIFFHLISDKGFKDWILKPNPKRSLYWTNWIHEHPEAESEINQAKEFIQRISFREYKLEEYEMENMFKSIISKEVALAKHQKRSALDELWSIGWSQLGRVAAILIFLLITAAGISYVTRGGFIDKAQQEANWITVSTRRGERQTVHLSDGSQVVLNYESTLTYPEKFPENSRKVELVGEAFFKVKRDSKRPFIVGAKGLKTEVLGTSFNVQAFESGKESIVSLVMGLVKVNSENTKDENPAVLLKPGEQMILNRQSNSIEKKPFEVEKVISWKDGIIIFDKTSFTDFIDKMEKWYGVDFQIYGSPSRDWNINGRYQDERLDDILKGLSFVYGIKYEINGKNITLEVK